MCTSAERVVLDGVRVHRDVAVGADTDAVAGAVADGVGDERHSRRVGGEGVDHLAREDHFGGLLAGADPVAKRVYDTRSERVSENAYPRGVADLPVGQSHRRLRICRRRQRDVGVGEARQFEVELLDRQPLREVPERPGGVERRQQVGEADDDEFAERRQFVIPGTVDHPPPLVEPVEDAPQRDPRGVCRRQQFAPGRGAASEYPQGSHPVRRAREKREIVDPCGHCPERGRRRQKSVASRVSGAKIGVETNGGTETDSVAAGGAGTFPARAASVHPRTYARIGYRSMSGTPSISYCST